MIAIKEEQAPHGQGAGKQKRTPPYLEMFKTVPTHTRQQQLACTFGDLFNLVTKGVFFDGAGRTKDMRNIFMAIIFGKVLKMINFRLQTEII